MVKVRVVYEKKEPARFVGHLDILRTFIRSFMRAGIKVKYSEGFNPHASITFLLPIGVGVTSECEVFDVTIDEEVLNLIDFSKNLADSLPAGFGIRECRVVHNKLPEVCKAYYEIELKSKTPIIRDEIVDAISMTEINVEKRSKKQIKTVNIMEHIFDFKIESLEGNMLKAGVLLSAGNTFNIKPELVFDGLSSVINSLEVEQIKPHRKYFMYAD